jgi:ribose transport system ATP-binding protein
LGLYIERKKRMSQQRVLFEAKDMFKSFGITKALKGIKLELRSSEVLGLIGENGSGKSTMTSIIAGIQPADSGAMFLEGKQYLPKNSVEANQSGICMILQEKSTFDHLSAANNIFIGAENHFMKMGILNSSLMKREAAKALQDIGASHISPSAMIGNLSFEDGKLVELARAISIRPKILIVDETTTALSRTGRDILYSIMEKMKKEGNSVIFISHDIDEMMDKCDRLTVLRDGNYIDTLEKKDFSPQIIRKLMVGREISDNYYRTDEVSCKNKEVVLKVKGVTAGNLDDINFSLHKGEILGFGGLADCGMHDIGRIAFGLLPLKSGEVIDAQGTKVNNPSQAMARKIGYIAKNRDQEALMTNSPILDNICIASYANLSKKGYVSPAEENKFVDQLAGQLEIKMQNSKQYVSELSGGNKQKVALAKWLGFGADILILDCPTRGIDIGVKANIYKLMKKLTLEGKSIILISEELPEVIGMSDRVLILKDGRINGEFRREENPTESMLIDYMV